MLLRPSRAARGNRPSGVFSLNRGHYLADQLSVVLAPRNGALVELVSHLVPTPSGSLVWNATPFQGVCPLFDNVSTSYDFTGVQYLQSTTPFTVAWREFIPSNPGTTYYGRLGLTVKGSASGGRLSIVRNDSVGNYQYLEASTGSNSVGSGIQFTGAATIANSVGVLHHFVLVGVAGPDNATAANWTLYQDGIPLSASVGSGTGAVQNTNNVVGNLSGWGPSNAFITDVMVWGSRALSAVEAYALYDPRTRWDLYWQPSSRVFFLPSGAPPVVTWMPAAIFGD